jgi:hypothetical protein
MVRRLTYPGHGRVGPALVICLPTCCRLATGADTERADSVMERTPLLWAASLGYAACVALLLGRGAAVDACGRAGATALHLAARGAHVDVAEALLRAGARTSARTRRGVPAAAPHIRRACSSFDWDLLVWS